MAAGRVLPRRVSHVERFLGVDDGGWLRVASYYGCAVSRLHQESRLGYGYVSALYRSVHIVLPQAGQTRLRSPRCSFSRSAYYHHHEIKMYPPSAVEGNSNILLYNGVAFGPVHARNSIVVPFSCRDVWRIVGNFGKQALWM